MKTIGELQSEVRLMQKELEKMGERLAKVDDGLTRFKETAQIDTSYEKIYEIAAKMPVIQHPIVGLSRDDKKTYIGAVLMAASLEDTINDDQMLFIQRMIMVDGMNNKIDDYIRDMGKITPRNIMYKLSENIQQKMSDSLLADMLITANLSRCCSEKSFKAIADVASLMKKEKAEMIQISVAAAAVLKQSVKDIGDRCTDVMKISAACGHYLEKVSGWDEKLKQAMEESLWEMHNKIAMFHAPDNY